MKSGCWMTVLVMILAVPAARADDPLASPLFDKTEEEGIQPGHSLHGGVFNQGPRQAAYLMEGMGEIDFPVTTDSPLAQKFINQGVGQLHGFWFFEAERSFRQAAQHDPDCAMAYWGMAMSNVMNHKRYDEFAGEAYKRINQASRREALYIDSLSNLKDLRRVIKHYPEDLEAKAFLGIYPYYRAQNEKKGLFNIEASDALLQEVLAEKPLHPAHHYVIHLWDITDSERALGSAAKVAHSAPGIAHMWHMAGHLYSLSQRHHEAAWYMEAALRLDHRYTIKDRVHPDVMHVYCHNAEWLVRTLAQIGHVHEAIDRAKDLIELPRHPSYNDLKPETSSLYGRQRLLEVLEQYELWDELIRLSQTPTLQSSTFLPDQVWRHRLLGTAYFRSGDDSAAEDQIQELSQLLKKQEELSGGEPSGRIDLVNAALNELRAHRAVIQKQRVWSTFSAGSLFGIAAVAMLLLLAVVMFERTVMRVAYLVVLLIAGGFGAYWLSGPAAYIQYTAPMYAARDLLAYGRNGQAVKAARAYVEEHPQEVQPLAALIDVLWQAGQEADAREEFDALREISSGSDLDMPCFERLAPLAAKFDYPQDWRIEKPLPAEHGDLPGLDSLGPIRWHPSPATDWTLPNNDGQAVSLSDLKGKPLVLVFYLGYGCLHCAEQLQEFADKAEEFEKAGLTVVAISTDEQALLKKSLENYKGGEFPFTLLADPKLEVFKQYRCYDDFENLTMHGTFLIDPEGLVRWQDISYEPFMDADFLIAESKRLLAQPVRGE